MVGQRIRLLGQRALRGFLRRRPPRYWLRRLANSPIFDQGYFELQTGFKFQTKDAAVRHFLSASPSQALSIHPLVEGAWIELTTQRFLPWHVGLIGGRQLQSTGPLFYIPGDCEAGGSAAGSLTQFISSATDASLLPRATSPHHQLTWGEAGTALRNLAALTSEQLRRSTRRNSPSWDFDAESKYRIALATTRLDAGSSDVVTIVMPTFNRASILDRAIQSVREQTIPEWQLVVVDDGSTDSTQQVLADWVSRDERIISIRQENAGVSAARNLGLTRVDTSHVAFLDSDNVWAPDFLSTSLAALRRSGKKAGFTCMEIHMDDGLEYLGAQVSFDELIDGRNQVDMNALVLRRDVIDEVGTFDTSLRRWVDYDFVLRVAKKFELDFIPILGVVYDHRASVGDRITTSESPLWRRVVVNKHLVDWADLNRNRGTRIAGRTSALMRSRCEWPATLKTIEDLLSKAAGQEVEVVVVDNASPRDEAAILTAAFLGDRRVVVHRVANDLQLPTSANVAFSKSTGDVVVVVEPGTPINHGWDVKARALANSHRAEIGVNLGEIGALLIATEKEFVAREGLTPMPVGDPLGESLQWSRPVV